MNACSYNLMLDAYHDGELPPAQAAELAAHLPGCAACAAELAALQRGTAAMASVTIPQLSPRAMRRIERAVDAAREPTYLRIIRRVTAVAAAVFIVSVGAIVLQQQKQGTKPPTGGAPAVQTIADWERAAVIRGDSDRSPTDDRRAFDTVMLRDLSRPSPSTAPDRQVSGK